MKQIKLFVIGIVLAFCFSACSEKMEHQYVLPKDASLVVAMNLKSMADKSGLSAGEGKALVGKLHDALVSGLDAEGTALLEQVLENPDASGLSLTDPVYFFVGRQVATMGLVARVQKSKDVEHLFNVLHKQGVCGELQEAEAMKWTVAGQLLLAYSDRAFLALYGNRTNKAEDLNYMAAVLLGQDEAGSYAARPEYRSMMEKQTDIALSGNMGIIPHEVVSMFSMGLPANLNLEEMRMEGTVDFEDGRVKMDFEHATDNEEIKAFMQKQQEAFPPLKGTYLDYFAPATACWISGNMKGEKAYSLLCENPTIRQTLESPLFPVDLYQIFQAIDGDICMALDANNAGFIMYADVTGSSFLQTFEDLKPLLAMTGGAMQLVTLGPDAYEFRGSYGAMRYIGLNRLWLGVKNNRFYMTNRQEAIDARPLGLNLHSQPWAKEVEGKRSFAYVSFPSLAKLLYGIPVSEVRTVANVFSTLDKLTVMSEDWQHTEVVLTSQDSKTNVLKQLLKGLEKL